MTRTLEIQHLSVDFLTDDGVVEAVCDASLTLEQREILAIVGESGSGKTVTARSVLQLVPDNARVHGTILLNGRDVTAMRPHELRQIRGRDAATIFQEPSTALNPVFPVGWQIVERLRAHTRISRKAAKSRAVELLALVGIPSPRERIAYYPHQLSGGQKQRVVIAMALAGDAGLIIADEPTTALDVTVQAEILDVLRAARDDFGRSILLITHNMGVVADLADRMMVMRSGTVLEAGTCTQVFSQPTHEYTRALLASVPSLTPREVSSSPSDAVHRPDLVVDVEDLHVRFPGSWRRPAFTAVRGVDLQIHSNEVLGVVGESGSGKTTIGRVLAGLTTATGGSVQVLGHQAVGARDREYLPARRRMGVVFQDPAASFNPKMTIADCIAEPLHTVKTDSPYPQVGQRVDELMDRVQLPRPLARRFPHELSGGQRQRASLARALALDPDLVIADEPTSALDVTVQAKVLDIFIDLQQQLGFAALFISHDLAVVAMLAHRVIVLRQGEVVESGSTRAVLTNPQDPYTRQLLDSVPLPDPGAQALRRQRRRAETVGIDVS